MIGRLIINGLKSLESIDFYSITATKHLRVKLFSLSLLSL